MIKFKHRLFFLVLMISIIFIAIVIRLVFLMVIKNEFYLNRSDGQIKKLIKIDSSRGKIFDRNMHPLAISQPVYSIYASPKLITNKRFFAQSVAKHIKMTPDQIYKKINNNLTFVWLRRKAEDVDPDLISKLSPQQINIIKEEKRVYPNSSSSSDILGFVGMDQGLGGLEYEFDDFLTGEGGYYIIKGDPRGVRIISSNKTLIGKVKGFSQSEFGIEASSLKGGSLVTTIDYRIQFLVETLLKENIERVEAQSGQVIVMDVKTGEIISMANYPYFNPNKYYEFESEYLKNSCLVDVFEPGSTFKIITYAAALEEKIVTPGTVLEIPETVIIARRKIKEARERKLNDPTHYPAKDILVRSMNVGTTMLADKMGKDAFLSYIHDFGFGSLSNIKLPGETKGLVRSLDTITKIDNAVMSFGQGISVTGLQLISAVATIGNNGIYNSPKIIKHKTDHNQLTISNPSQFSQRRVVSNSTAKLVRDAMEEVVSEGSGRYAKVAGYRVGGKTGTAQKPLENGLGYEEGAYIASFVGLLPIQSPRFAIFVSIDEPGTTIWGSTAAAPLFSKIATVLIDYYDIEPNFTALN